MTLNDYSVIDAQNSLSALIKEQTELSVDMDSGFVSVREPNENDDLTFN